MSPSTFRLPKIHVMSGEFAKNSDFIRDYLHTHRIIIVEFVDAPASHDVVWYISATDANALNMLTSSSMMLQDKPVIIAVAECDIKQVATLEQRVSTLQNSQIRFIVGMVPDQIDKTGEIITFSAESINRLLLATIELIRAAYLHSLLPNQQIIRNNIANTTNAIIDGAAKQMQGVLPDPNLNSPPPPACGAMFAQIAAAYNFQLSPQEIEAIWKEVYGPAMIQYIKIGNPKQSQIYKTLAGIGGSALPGRVDTMESITLITGELVTWICDVLTSLGATKFADVGIRWVNSLADVRFVQ